MFALGHGVPQDDKEAAKWYRKAAEQGSVDAQEKLGDMFNEGEGIPQNFNEAAN
jgi:TPR repeat protein